MCQMGKYEVLSWDSPGAAALPRDNQIQPDGEVGSFGAPCGNRLELDLLIRFLPCLNLKEMIGLSIHRVQISSSDRIVDILGWIVSPIRLLLEY